MKTLSRLAFFVLCAVLLASLVQPARAQTPSCPCLALRLSRTFGYSSGTGDIQGNFKLKATGPDDLARVSFYLDDELLGYSVVEPYSFKWVITMENLKVNRNMEPIYETRPITNPDGSISMEQVMVTWVEVSPDGKTVTQTWESGKMAIQGTGGYTESHLIHVVAYDAAGNKTESEKVRFYVIHKPKEKEEEQPSGAIWWFDAGWAGLLDRVTRPPAVAAIPLLSPPPRPPTRHLSC